MSSFHKGGREDIGEALQLFLKAVELDDNFSTAYGMAAWCYGRRKVNGWVEEGRSESSDAMKMAERIVQCGRDDAIAPPAEALQSVYLVIPSVAQS
jgi:hypothetical protein